MKESKDRKEAAIVKAVGELQKVMTKINIIIAQLIDTLKKIEYH